MRINIGTQNSPKIQAVQEVCQNYNFISQAKILPIKVATNIFGQPKSLQETIKGAIDRAKNSFKNCQLSIGIEDGLMKVPFSLTGYMNICVCAIYDGKKHYLGLSSGFEYPQKVTDLVLKQPLDISQAYRKLGLTKKIKIGAEEGVIYDLTNGRINRKEYTKQAITNALIYLENSPPLQ